ncbi:MAG: hypothetical protein HY537_17935 [Deltaproteobacteria bacterium]|nr:hypothetical protein [Deltaproteobacteria bacterium]
MNLLLLKSPKELSPFTYLSLNEWYIHFNITANLLDLDNENQIVAGLAKSWTVEDEGRKYKFKLDTSRRWSDGSPITAHQILGSLTHEAKHKNAKFLPKILRPGPIDKAIYLEGPDILVFRLHTASDKFLYHLARPEFGILDADSFRQTDFFSKTTRTSGNYKIEELTDTTAVLVPNPFNPSVSANNPQRVVFSVVSDHAKQKQLISEGKVDFFEVQSDEMLRVGTQSGHYQVIEGGLDNLATLQARKVTPAQLHALQVLNHFLNRETFAKGSKRVAGRMVAISEVPVSEHSPRLTIEEAKLQLGKPVEMTLTLSDEATADQAADAKLIKSEAEKIGIHITIHSSPAGFRKQWEQEEYGLTMTRMGVYAYDEVELLNGYFCEGFRPYLSLSRLVCKEINEAARPGTAMAKRKSLLRQAYENLNKSGYILSLYHFPRRFLIHNKWDLRNYNNLLPFPIFNHFYVRKG